MKGLKTKSRISARDQLDSKIMNIFLTVNLFYYSYRYILKYNSESTSPTYQNTPIQLQTAKYVIVSALLLILLIYKKGRIRCNKENYMIFFSSCFMIVQISILLVLNMDQYDSRYITFAVSLITILFYLSNDCKINYIKIENILNIYWWYTVLYEMMQILLYAFNGRLPALAYGTGNITDVRFGGALDAPNEFSIILSFYLLYIFFKYSGMKRAIMLISWFVMFLLTWSGTGFLSCLIALIIVYIFKIQDKSFNNRITIFFLIVTLLTSVIIIVNYSRIREIIIYYMSSKEKSVLGHLNGWDLSEVNFLAFFGIYPNDVGGEVGITRILTFGGIPELIALFTLGICSVNKLLKYLRINENQKLEPLIYGALIYQITFMISLFNLPSIYTFSSMFFFSFTVIISCNVLREAKPCENRDL